jgi:hypothetical protein
MRKKIGGRLIPEHLTQFVIAVQRRSDGTEIAIN